MKGIKRFFDVAVPRFITEDVAIYNGAIVCAMDDIRPGERFDGVLTVRSFNLFGLGLFPSAVGAVRPWPVRQ